MSEDDDIHASLGGSSAPRWTRCPGSVAMNEGRVSEESSYAIEGTVAHALAEHCNRKRISVYEAIDQGWAYRKPVDVVIDDDFLHHVQQYVDRCLDYTGDHYVETKVNFDPWVPGNWGFVDFAAFNSGTRRMVIRDLKFGQGVQVDAVENEQLLLYAIGMYEEYGMLYHIERVIMEIDQPRLDHVSQWEINLKELMQRAVWFHERYEMTCTPDAPLVPGEKQCQWCASKGECKALASMTYNLIVDEFEDVEDDFFA